MMTSQVVYDGDLRTVCTHLKSQTIVKTDAPTDNHGKGESFSPTDLLATSLAACMLTIMGVKADSMDVNIEGIKIEVLKTMAANPRKVSAIALYVHIPERLATLEQKDITILKNAALTCPVAKSIHPDIEVNIDWGIWSK